MQTPQQHLTAIADLCQKFHRELDELLESNPLPVETNRVLEDAAKAIDGPLDFFVLFANQRIGWTPDERSTLDYKMSIHGFQRKAAPAAAPERTWRGQIMNTLMRPTTAVPKECDSPDCYHRVDGKCLCPVVKDLQEKVDGALNVIAIASSDYDPPMRPYWLVSIEEELKDK
jgi:hypothetical protein